mmetsp:Transcript_25711/g.39535  ORF Transcript_25711/g.39535 Transcript_25711/m.39535 type:complete len:122 (+) Transcript_25711:81-446(+)|eukprot:CAMPEP_0170494472 /NCGR_PEP_ID=MMETSP0208-20121228/14664_1 /TAXON_ID=197538 /ORGANISM="Strombidium inclinatum, Strain S3" /LENGTH=121 /DNA_ID=CAMNT_0010770533 /DNA_START=28 /DNA_END=393 /DNA_ORIENTATION=+
MAHAGKFVVFSADAACSDVAKTTQCSYAASVSGDDSLLCSEITHEVGDVENVFRACVPPEHCGQHLKEEDNGAITRYFIDCGKENLSPIRDFLDFSLDNFKLYQEEVEDFDPVCNMTGNPD